MMINLRHLNNIKIATNVMKLIIKIWFKLNNSIIGSLISMLAAKIRGDKIKA